MKRMTTFARHRSIPACLALAACTAPAAAAVAVATAFATVVAPESVAAPTLIQFLDRFAPPIPLLGNTESGGAVQVKLPMLNASPPPSAAGGGTTGSGPGVGTATGASAAAAATGVGSLSGSGSSGTGTPESTAAITAAESGGSQPVRNADGSVSINLTGTAVARTVTRMADGQLLVDFN